MNFADIDLSGQISGEIKTICPNCSHTRKKKTDRCLSVNIDKRLFKCWHCGIAGGENGNGFIYQKPEFRRVAPPNPVLEWFQERGITKATLDDFDISFEDGWISYPYKENGNVVHIKYRTRDKKFKSTKDSKHILYNIDSVTDADKIIIVEGENDVLALYEAGYENVVSVPDGAQSLGWYKHAEKYFENVKEFVIAVDNDEPGQKLAQEIARRIGRYKCKIVDWGAGKDANDVLARFDKNAVRQAIGNAHSIPEFGLVRVSDFAHRVFDLKEKGLSAGCQTGLFGSNYTVKEKQFTTVTGTPGTGKTELVESICYYIIKEYWWPVTFFTPESMPFERQLVRLAQKAFKKPLSEISNEELQVFVDWAERWIEYVNPLDQINPDNGRFVNYDLDMILDSFKKSIYRIGSRLLVIDPWNEIEHSRPSGMSETEYIGQSLSKINKFCQHYDCHIFIVAHPKKVERTATGYAVVKPYDISGSANWYNKSYNILSLWRDMDSSDSLVDVYIQKIKFSEIGSLGTHTFEFNMSNGCYKKTDTREIEQQQSESW